MSLELGLAVVGLVLTILLVVLDKAGKLKGQVLYWLLAVAALMTLPLVLGNPFVAEAPALWKYWLRACSVSVVVLGFWAIGIWISPNPVEDPPKPRPPSPPTIANDKTPPELKRPTSPVAKKPVNTEPEIEFAPAGFVSFVGQVNNGWAPMLQENQTQEPLYDVQLHVSQAVLQSATDPGPWTSEWQKQIDIGTARALLTKGLDERFYVGKHDYVRFDISMLTRFISYREIIVMAKENENRYKAELSFYKGGEGKPTYKRTMTVGIVTNP
jgi:hypothetical protein